MFKLVKVLNSPTTSPQLIRRKTMANYRYKRGMLLEMNANGELKPLTDGKLPTHISCEDLNKGEKDTILCYEVLDNMIFSAIALCDMRSIAPGVKVILAPDDDGVPTYPISDSDGGYIMIYDNCGAEKMGDTVLVRFIK